MFSFLVIWFWTVAFMTLVSQVDYEEFMYIFDRINRVGLI